MTAFLAAFRAELLKARRARITWLIALGFLILPLVDGLFMIILKDPEQARALGLISTKAEIMAGTADWPAFFSILLQGQAMGGAILYALITAWVFGREFSDHTAKELLALPTPRGTIVAAKLGLIALWGLGLSLFIFLVGLGVGMAVEIPGGSVALALSSGLDVLHIAALTLMLMPFVALLASAGRGYLPPLGWMILTLALGNIISLLGWGDWFPWAVPMLISGMGDTHGVQGLLHSYVVVALAFAVGAGSLFAWWRWADQNR
jgi:ABC-type transport system involved in multi-copper enzyme maturation permease subunit